MLAGSNGKPAPATAAVEHIAHMEALRLGPRGRSACIQSLALGAFNKPFEPARTSSDWLSRDPKEVDKYLADPLCGFQPSVQLWIDLLEALPEIANPARQARIPKQLPIYVIAGMCDPVGQNVKGLEQLMAAYHDAGLERVAHRFYPEARHELFNETNRDEVTYDLIAWLNRLSDDPGS